MFEKFMMKHLWMLNHIDSVTRNGQDHIVKISDSEGSITLTYNYIYPSEGRIFICVRMENREGTLYEEFDPVECPVTMLFLQTVADRLYQQLIVRSELSWTAKKFLCLDRQLYGMGEYW